MFGRKKSKKAHKAKPPKTPARVARVAAREASDEIIDIPDEDVALLEGEGEGDPKNANKATQLEAELAAEDVPIPRGPAVTDGARTHTPNQASGGRKRKWKNTHSSSAGV